MASSFQVWMNPISFSLVTTDNPAFEKRVVVHAVSSDQVRLLLTCDFANQLVPLQSILGKRIALSFARKGAYLAIPCNRHRSSRRSGQRWPVGDGTKPATRPSGS